MTTQQFHHNFIVKKQDADDNLFKECDNFATFEEAFDTTSLLKFFHEHESTNSQSAYSPQKEVSVFEDIPIFVLDDHDFFSSSSQDPKLELSRSTLFGESYVDSNSKFKVQEAHQTNYPQTHGVHALDADYSSSPKLKAASRIKHTENIQIYVHQENLTVIKQNEAKNWTAHTAMPDKSHFSHDRQDVKKGPELSSENEHISSFEKLLHSKKIFKIERNVKRPSLMKQKRQAKSSKIVTVPFKIHSKKNRNTSAKHDISIDFSEMNRITTDLPQNVMNTIKAIVKGTSFYAGDI